MSDFADTVRSFSLAVPNYAKRVYVKVAIAVHDSIQVGSPITGSPGQPVGQYGPGYHPGKIGGSLRGSWLLTWPNGEALIATNLVYAPFIEDGVSWQGTEMKLHTSIGGFHSVKMTVLNFDRLVASEMAKAAAAAA
jgi:hypothetical protein